MSRARASVVVLPRVRWCEEQVMDFGRLYFK